VTAAPTARAEVAGELLQSIRLYRLWPIEEHRQGILVAWRQLQRATGQGEPVPPTAIACQSPYVVGSSGSWRLW